MQLRTLGRIGDNTIVSLPEEMLAALQLAAGDMVTIDFDARGRCITIGQHVAEAESITVGFARQVADFIEEFRPVLEALAQ